MRTGAVVATRLVVVFVEIGQDGVVKAGEQREENKVSDGAISPCAGLKVYGARSASPKL